MSSPVGPPPDPSTSPGPAVPGRPEPGGPGDPAAGHPHQSEQTTPAAGFDSRGHVRRGRVSATWVGIIAATIVLVLLIIFIAQNLNTPTIHFLGASGHFPLGLIVLLSAIAGVVLTAVPGSIRIMQLRRALKKNTPKDQRLS